MITALNEAALAIAEGLSLPRTLQRIADTARTLAQTKYAALGVLADDGRQLRQFITSGIEPQIARHIHHEPRGEGLLGDIFRTEKPINVARIQDDPRSAGFCENHPLMTSFLGVPITNRGDRIGNLYLSDRLDGKPFDERDEEMLTLLASHAAIAIENARLHEALQLAALRVERDRIGMELHDGVIQSIYAVGMKLEIVQSKLPLEPEHVAQFQIIMQDLNKIIEDIRAYIRNLLSVHDEQTALFTHIKNLTTHFQDFSGVQVTLDVRDDIPILSDLHRHNLLQIIREGLANIARHANASEASVSVAHDERELHLTIADNGEGFDTGDNNLISEGHFGLRNMMQRAQRFGGELTIQSNPGQGTVLTVRLPLKTGF